MGKWTLNKSTNNDKSILGPLTDNRELALQMRIQELFITLDKVLFLSDLCTEQLISLRSLAAKLAQSYISAVRCTNVYTGILSPSY